MRLALRLVVVLPVAAAISACTAGATIPAVSGFTIDDRSGFKVLPGELVTDGHIEGLRVTAKRRDDRHPQENLRAFTDELRGSVSPEQDDTFITEDIDPDDL